MQEPGEDQGRECEGEEADSEVCEGEARDFEDAHADLGEDQEGV